MENSVIAQKWTETKEKRRSTPGDKWEVEMEVDTRRKASVTLSAKFSAAISTKFSAEFMQISDNFPLILNLVIDPKTDH